MAYFHSVKLIEEKCHGCTNCISHCPTEAIRVRHGKAKIIKQRCIDCGECIRVCQSHAKVAAADSLSMLEKFKYNIAMPAPSFYSQFSSDIAVNKILNAFLEIGFDHVFEVARGAEYISAAAREKIASGDLKKPVISSACPAVLRLMRERFPELLEHVLTLISPMEAAAMLAREEAVKTTGLAPSEIGIFFISPCPAKVTSIKSPLTLEKSNVDGAISVRDVYSKIIPLLDKVEEKKNLAVSGREGIVWARSGGECRATGVDDYMAVDGINNVLQVLEELEYGKMKAVEFIELSACVSGCSGGALNIENPFLASRRITQQSKKAKVQESNVPCEIEKFSWQKEVTGRVHSGLDDDFEEAMRKMEKMDELCKKFPQLDCGSCGAPSCKALAEDIVRGYATENDCVFIMRKKVNKLAKKLFELNEDFEASKK